MAEPLRSKDDRYGGVEVDVTEAAGAMAPAEFDLVLREACAEWAAQGKKGVWLKVPLASGSAVGAAAANGFIFHHAQPAYAMMTRWLPPVPSTLPNYSFTQIGVGGVVFSSRNEVLLVQETVSPIPQLQGCWKLPGGLADPGEDFMQTARREVLEETGVDGEPMGVVTLRHSHGYRFGQGDVYVTVKLQATSDALRIDPVEIAAAEWMSLDRMRSILEHDPKAELNGKISVGTFRQIEAAMEGPLIKAETLPGRNGNKGPTLYAAARV